MSRQKFEPGTSRIQAYSVTATLTPLRIRTSATRVPSVPMWHQCGPTSEAKQASLSPSPPTFRFTRTCHWTLSWARTIQTTHSHCRGIFKIHFNNTCPSSTPRFSQWASHLTFANENAARISCSVDLTTSSIPNLNIRESHNNNNAVSPIDATAPCFYSFSRKSVQRDRSNKTWQPLCAFTKYTRTSLFSIQKEIWLLSHSSVWKNIAVFYYIQIKILISCERDRTWS